MTAYKYYISGSMGLWATIDPRQAAEFNDAAALLRALGLDVINSAENICDENTSWEQWARCNIRLLLTCDAIVMLPNWEQGKCAQLEYHIARQIGMTIRFIQEFAR